MKPHIHAESSVDMGLEAIADDILGGLWHGSGHDGHNKRIVSAGLDYLRTKLYNECADYCLRLHLDRRPDTTGIDALKTAYDEFRKRARK